MPEGQGAETSEDLPEDAELVLDGAEAGSFEEQSLPTSTPAANPDQQDQSSPATVALTTETSKAAKGNLTSGAISKLRNASKNAANKGLNAVLDGLSTPALKALSNELTDFRKGGGLLVNQGFAQRAFDAIKSIATTKTEEFQPEQASESLGELANDEADPAKRDDAASILLKLTATVLRDDQSTSDEKLAAIGEIAKSSGFLERNQTKEQRAESCTSAIKKLGASDKIRPFEQRARQSAQEEEKKETNSATPDSQTEQEEREGYKSHIFGYIKTAGIAAVSITLAMLPGGFMLAAALVAAYLVYSRFQSSDKQKDNSEMGQNSRSHSQLRGGAESVISQAASVSDKYSAKGVQDESKPEAAQQSDEGAEDAKQQAAATPDAPVQIGTKSAEVTTVRNDGSIDIASAVAQVSQALTANNSRIEDGDEKIRGVQPIAANIQQNSDVGR